LVVEDIVGNRNERHNAAVEYGLPRCYAVERIGVLDKRDLVSGKNGLFIRYKTAGWRIHTERRNQGLAIGFTDVELIVVEYVQTQRRGFVLVRRGIESSRDFVAVYKSIVIAIGFGAQFVRDFRIF